MTRLRLLRVVVPLPVLVLLSAAAWAAEPIAEITLVAGSSEVVRAADKSVVPARADLDLFVGDTVRTKADGKAEIKFGEGALLRLAENTEVKLNQTAQKNTVVVLVGKLWAHIKKLFGRSKFEIETPAAVAGVRGTTLRVEVPEIGDQVFAVDDGEIEVVADGEATRVGAQRELLVGRQGRRLRRFDPRSRRPWEFWTDALVMAALSALKTQATERLAAAKGCRREVLTLQEGLATDLASAGRLHQRAVDLKGEIGEVAAGLAELRRQHQKLERDAQRMPPARLQRERARIAREAGQLAARGKAIGRELILVNTLVKRGQERGQERSRTREALSDRTNGLLAQHQELRQRIARLEAVRRLDPRWQQFQPLHAESAALERDLGERLAEAQQWMSEADDLPGPHRLGAGRRLKMLTSSLGEAQGLWGANQATWRKTEPDLGAFADRFRRDAPGRGRRGRP